jgi:hypothetical protein
MSEQYPGPEEDPLQEVIQPPKILFEAMLVPPLGEPIPVSNQSTQVHSFEDGGMSYIDVVEKMRRRRIFTEDLLTLEVLSEMGCLTVTYFNEPELAESCPPTVTAGDDWEVFDANGEVSFTEELRRYGRIITRPKAPVDDLEFDFKRKSPSIPLETTAGTINLNYFNTAVFQYQEYPEMDHVLIMVKNPGKQTTRIRLFNESKLVRSLADRRFTLTSSVYPSKAVVAAYVDYLEHDFENQARDLLLKPVDPEPDTD